MKKLLTFIVPPLLAGCFVVISLPVIITAALANADGIHIKRITLLALTIFLAACSNTQSSRARIVSEQEYNVAKDEWFNNTLDTGVMLYSYRDEMQFEYTYAGFDVKGFPVLDSSLEINDSAGRMVLFDSTMGAAEHRVRPETIQRLFKLGMGVPYGKHTVNDYLLYSYSKLKYHTISGKRFVSNF